MPFIDALGFDIVAQTFEPRETGDPTVSPTGFVTTSTGTDISAQLAPLSVGSEISYNTNLKSGSSDLRLIFAKRGSRAGAPLIASIPRGLELYDYPPYGGLVHGYVTCSASGGSAPYTYLWQLVSGVSCFVSGTTTDTVEVAHVAQPLPGYVATINCKVNDSNGTTVVSNNCLVTFEYYEVPN